MWHVEHGWVGQPEPIVNEAVCCKLVSPFGLIFGLIAKKVGP